MVQAHAPWIQSRCHFSCPGQVQLLGERHMVRAQISRILLTGEENNPDGDRNPAFPRDHNQRAVMSTSRSTSTALPKTNSPQVQQIADEDPNYLSAYRICLQYEIELAVDEDKLRHLRILGFLLLNAPHRGVRSEVVRSIHSRKRDSDLVSFGALLERYLLLPCGFLRLPALTSCVLTSPIFLSCQVMKHRSRTLVPSEHWSRSPSPFGVMKDQVQVDITEAPKNHKDAKDRVCK